MWGEDGVRGEGGGRGEDGVMRGESRSDSRSMGCTLLPSEHHVGEAGLLLLVLHEAQGAQRSVLSVGLLQVLQGVEGTRPACGV